MRDRIGRVVAFRAHHRTDERRGQLVKARCFFDVAIVLAATVATTSALVSPGSRRTVRPPSSGFALTDCDAAPACRTPSWSYVREVGFSVWSSTAPDVGIRELWNQGCDREHEEKAVHGLL